MTAREIFRMVLVLTIVTGIWGGLLSLVKMATEDQIQYQRIKNIKAPALKKALTVDYDNDPVKDRRIVVVGQDSKGKPVEKTFFLAKKNGQIQAVALEAFGGGYEDDIGVMMSILVDQDQLGGIAITTHSETPGVGTKAFESTKFMDQFSNQPLTKNFGPRGGQVDAVTGATYTANGVMTAVQRGIEIYQQIKSKIIQ